MMVAEWALWIAAGLAALPAFLFLWNLFYFRPAPRPAEGAAPGVSVLIPARDEEAGIAAAVRCALASRDAEVEVVVMDDQSTDRTAAIVEELAEGDLRVRLLRAPALPAGWCGKQHACSLLAEAARHDLLCFVDADVRLHPEAAARLAAFLRASGSDLVSAFPRQETGSFLEKLLLPLMHFLLLGYLPFRGMRRTLRPAFGAGCGQLFLARRDGYRAAGGHGAIRGSLHDGVKLPRAFRKAGRRTDVCDGTDLAVCRMYRGAAQVWRGLGKNAGEGIAAPGTIGPFTFLLGGGQLAPFAAGGGAAAGWWDLPGAGPALAAAGMGLAYLPRVFAVLLFRQSVLGALLHPVGIAVFLVLQWQAWWRARRGGKVEWRARAYSS